MNKLTFYSRPHSCPTCECVLGGGQSIRRVTYTLQLAIARLYFFYGHHSLPPGLLLTFQWPPSRTFCGFSLGERACI